MPRWVVRLALLFPLAVGAITLVLKLCVLQQNYYAANPYILIEFIVAVLSAVGMGMGALLLAGIGLLVYWFFHRYMNRHYHE
jgi:hypothetical protein